MSKEELINKIKKGIIKSGFPLELKIGSLLEKNNWAYSINNLYEDFETGKFRESDISAQKIVNGITINLYIECKKSTEKQIILYSPRNRKISAFMNLWLKLFPKLKAQNEKSYSIRDILSEFSSLPYFDKEIPFSKSIIVTKGDSVTSDNVSYLSSINGMIKNSIHDYNTTYLEDEFRNVYFYLLVFDGLIFQLSNSKKEDFELKEIEYGQLEFEYHFNFESKYYSGLHDDLVRSASIFGNKYVVEFINPRLFESHINKLEDIISKVNVKKLDGWGKPDK